MKGRQFTVVIQRKNDHPYTLDCDSKVYCVNNSKARTLHLIRGHKYMFNIIQSPNRYGDYDHELYFTGSSIGGEGGKKSLWGCKSTYSGPLLLEVTDEMPEYLYYQDRNHKYMGGLIIIHSKKEYKQLQRKKNM